MKTRTGFVSNSSSASFCVNLDVITARHALKLMEYSKLPEEYFKRSYKDHWDITVDFKKGFIRGWTSMDNGDLDKYLKKEKVDVSLFSWDDES